MENQEVIKIGQTTVKYEPIPIPARREVTYYDEQGNPVEKEYGSSIRIVEYDENNQRIREVWGTYTPQKTR